MLMKDRLGPAPQSGSANPAEIEKFDEMAREWRDPEGKFKAAHAFNAARIPLLQDQLALRLGRAGAGAQPLANLRIADVGCATGLISEAVARDGASVLAIDAAARNIEIARRAAQAAGLDIDYRVALPEQISDLADGFDAVLSLEIVEHVADLELFLASVARLVKPGGLLAVGTLNRTASSYLKAIIGAEYIFGMLPRGTHDWRAFVRPKELNDKLAKWNCKPEALFGLELAPLTWRWKVTANPAVNYMAFFRKSAA